MKFSSSSCLDSHLAISYWIYSSVLRLTSRFTLTGLLKETPVLRGPPIVLSVTFAPLSLVFLGSSGFERVLSFLLNGAKLVALRWLSLVGFPIDFLSMSYCFI